ncbi:MAG: UbiA prenyltransferase family protein [Cyclobacteriaceae bacterium]|nr:UbiA prenyltransferase family protein [Cyclobacteriaceae bacterium]
MLLKSILLHLRFPFSFFLMPVYFFALAISPNLNGDRLLWSFIIIHLFLYPASNGFNSYFDKDEGSIGGLKNPPPVNIGLYYSSILLDVLAIALAIFKINLLFGVMLFVYGLVSKAYSHPMIRLKKYPIAGWLTVGVFQGGFTLLMSYVAINNFGLENLYNVRVLIPAGLSSIILLGTYPMTQIYQHVEDAKRGDKTISLMLGLRGTFIFVLVLFTFVTAGYVAYFYRFHSLWYGEVFVLALSPVVIFFLSWFYRVWNNPSKANFTNTMWLNFLSACCLNGFFIWFFLESSHILQL